MRHRITTWMALADFFTALALVAFGVYASERIKLRNREEELRKAKEELERSMRVAETVRRFAGRLTRSLQKDGVKVKFDEHNAAITLQEGILFDSGSAELKNTRVLDRLAKHLGMIQMDDTLRRSFFLEIRGHTDAWPVNRAVDVGIVDNLDLSQKRAQAVQRQLSSNGIRAPAFHVVAQGRGEYEPVVPNCAGGGGQIERCNGKALYSSEQLAPNRRIEIRFGVFTGSAADSASVALRTVAPVVDGKAQ